MDRLILLKDRVGEKSESVLGGIVRRVVGRPSTTNVLKGELLEQIPGDALVPRSEGQNVLKPYNYRLLKDPAVAIYCSEYDVAPLSDKEFLLLEAIQSLSARYEVFIVGNKLEWGCGLKPGDTVYVSIPGPTVTPNQRAAATIRYVGGLPPEPGSMFGIEITDEQYRGHGTTDGTFRHARYFLCEEKCGLFVALDKLSMNPEGNTLEKAPRGGQSNSYAVSRGSTTSGRSYPQDNGPPADNLRPRSQAIQQPNVRDDQRPRFKKGDRVVAFDRKGNCIHGTVCWAGSSEKIRNIVAIETDVAVSTIDFEGAIPGMTYLFSGPRNRHDRLVMPEVAILSEEEAAGDSVDHQKKPPSTEKIDIENTSILAKEMGVSKKQLLANQKAVLREAEKSKQAKATQGLDQLKQAVPDQSVNLDHQRVAALQAFERDDKVSKRSSLPPRGEAYTGDHLQPCLPQRQHSYEPVLNSSNSQRKHMSSQTKSASLAQGEQLYDRLDDRQKQAKATQELDQLKQAVPDQSVNLDHQRVALQEALERDDKVSKRSSLPPRGEAYTGDHLQPRLPQRQHSYEPVLNSSNSQREHLSSQTKSASLAQGEQLYDRLDDRQKQAKATQELDQLKQAVPDQSVNLDHQRVALQEALERDDKVSKRSSLPPRGEAYTGDHLQPRLPQRQHSYEPVLNSSNSQRKHLSSQTKSASLAQGEQLYDRLDDRQKQAKATQELDQLKQAVPDQSVNLDHQRVALQEALERDDKVSKRSSLPPRGEAYTGDHLQPRLPQRQHSYEPVLNSSNSQREHLSSQTKSASLAQGEQLYDRLDDRQKQAKATQELDQLKQAVPDQSVNLDHQRVALQEALERDDKVSKRSSLPPRGEAYTGDHLQPRLPQRQHSYEPVLNSSNSQRKHLSSQTKSASLAQGEQLYDRLDDRSYPQKQPHKHSGEPQPFPRNLSDQLQKQMYEQPQSEHPLHKPPYKQPVQQPHQPLQQLPQQQPQQPLQWPLLPPPYEHRPQAGVPPSGGELFAFAHGSTDHQVHRSLSKGSTVQLVTFDGAGPQQPRYGVIHWAGEITGVAGTIAGIELEEPMEGCTDGTFQMTGEKFFDCPDGRGLFYPLESVKPDERFTDPGATPGAAAVANQSQEKKSLQEQSAQRKEEATQTRQQLQQLQQTLDSAIAEKKSLQEQMVQQREEATQTRQQLQQQLDDASAELQGLQDIEPWKVSRDKVEIWTEIGSGGWGSVSEGTLRVAIKQLHRQILSSHYVDRLQREMRMLAQVRHPNLVQFLGVVLDEAALRLQEPPMIITELLDMNLRKAYERKLGFNKLSVFQDVARALNYLHQRHDPIIHRDVSAPNVLLEALPNGMWKGKVSDLGSANLAKLAHTLAEGAIIYAAPETLPQLAHQAHDPHSPPPPQTTKIDVYSYGILLCEVATSRFPDPAQYHDMLGQVQREWPFMYGLILSCTKYNSVERPTMAEVLTKLIQS